MLGQRCIGGSIESHYIRALDPVNDVEECSGRTNCCLQLHTDRIHVAVDESMEEEHRACPDERLFVFFCDAVAYLDRFMFSL